VGAAIVIGGSMLCALGNPAVAPRPVRKTELNLAADENRVGS
jgi:hypothetical protein